LGAYHGEQDVEWPGGDLYPMPGTYLPVLIHEMKSALGAEEFPEDYVWHMVLICREVKRVLRDDGVFWLNIADSYNGSGGAGGDYNEGGLKEGQPKYPGHHIEYLTAGDAIGIPWRLAFALQADGWTLRGVPLWVKDSVMPEPVDGWRFAPDACSCMTDRREASIREQMAEQGVERHRVYRKAGDIEHDHQCPKCGGSGCVGDERLRQGSWRHTRSYEQIFMLTKGMGYFADRAMAKMVMQTDANPRDILRPARSNYKGEHFATYPPSLVVPLIAATVPRHACPAWARRGRSPRFPFATGRPARATTRVSLWPGGCSTRSSVPGARRWRLRSWAWTGPGWTSRANTCGKRRRCGFSSGRLLDASMTCRCSGANSREREAEGRALGYAVSGLWTGRRER